MQGDKIVIAKLNIVLGNKLISINQKFLHSRMLNDWGFDALGKAEYKKSIDDMKQADKIITRILFLQGLPNLQNLGTLRIGENAPEIIQCEIYFSNRQLKGLREAIDVCETQADFVSRQLLDQILDDEEEFFDWLEIQRGLINKTGQKNYLQSQI